MKKKVSKKVNKKSNKTGKVYVIQDRQAGNVIEFHTNKAAAKKQLSAFERQDKREGVYEDDFYEIVEMSKKEALKRLGR